MKVKIELDHWYARGWVNLMGGNYDPLLENYNDQKCCLGFCALAHGAEVIEDKTTPSDIYDQLPKGNWMLCGDLTSELGDLTSELADLAMEINDATATDSKNPIEVRMGNLITVFAEGGDELEFVPPAMTPQEQRVAIAKICGWVTDAGYKDSLLENSFCGSCPSKGIKWQKCPDYLNDLNAMHEAVNIKWLSDMDKFHNDRFTNEQYKRYCGLLNGNVDATAAQRAKAFLRVFNLWTEE